MPSSVLRNFHFSRRICKNFFEPDKTLKGLCFSGRLFEAVEILCRKGSPVNPQTYAFLLQECINLKDFKLGRRIHAQMIIVGFAIDEYLRTKLVILYAKKGDLETAHRLLAKIPERNLVSWNAMISGYVQKGLEEEGLNLYHGMRRVGLKPDQFTFASVFRACAGLATLEEGKQAHGVMIKTQIKGNIVVNSALVDMYFKCSSPDDGRRIFDKSSERNVVMWTALISGYGQHGCVEEVLGLFHRMIDEGFRPNYITFLAVLSACSHGGLITEGQMYFSSMTRDFKIKPSGEHYAAMVDLLGRAGRLDEAYDLVWKSPCKQHAVIWGALLGACRVHGDIELAKITAKRFFELEPENAGKYVVLSNAFAGFGLWENVAVVREMMKQSGMSKEPGCSWIEVQREVHTFFVGDKSHEQTEQIYEMIRELACILKEEGYVLDIKSG
ncbi:pentatricopeptide repeat-containing protein At4g16470 [Magnolia sinica]|uniref:pentatricopeptide repeat-containing protein At4g16470 n=1 Tax=Magnolia sinica TaxID=86752 RepID=UPI00265AED24|nr:pentatricopeptide repeat-containing protein At4g16470 [Magnolia sinica]XP_058070710.1 pentatricopeptide repeat-containing protein At4g16470 [Magnolia sinica]